MKKLVLATLILLSFNILPIKTNFLHGKITVKNSKPIAYNQHIITTKGEPIKFMLQAADNEDIALSYTIIKQPANGSLEIAMPFVTYKSDILGKDSFTFRVSDGENDSNIATVAISVKKSKTLILETGQTVCYGYGKNKKEYCTHSHEGQDGYFRKGASRSYKRIEINATSGIVMDNVTGLIWQDEKYTLDESFAYNNDFEYGKVLNWENARIYCNALTFAGYDDWRLPNMSELESIIDYGRHRNTAKDSYGAINTIFKYVGQAGESRYWQSVENPSYPSIAWSVHFKHGNGSWSGKSDTFYVRCVR